MHIFGSTNGKAKKEKWSLLAAPTPCLDVSFWTTLWTFFKRGRFLYNSIYYVSGSFWISALILCQNTCFVFCSFWNLHFAWFPLVFRAEEWSVRKTLFSPETPSLWLDFFEQRYMSFERECFALSKNLLHLIVHANFCQFLEKCLRSEKWILPIFPHSVVSHLKKNILFHQNKRFVVW